MNDAIWWIGAATCAAGGIGAVAILTTWAVDRALRLTGFSKALLQAYARLQTEKMRERQGRKAA